MRSLNPARSQFDKSNTYSYTDKQVSGIFRYAFFFGLTSGIAIALAIVDALR